MRIIWLLALICMCACWANLHAAAQEGEGPGASAQEGGESGEGDADDEARRRRFRTGNVAKLEIGDKVVAVSYGDTAVEGQDYEALADIADGDVVRLTQSIVTKLKTDVDLKFGDTPIKTGNVAKDYPGVYGLWLKRAGDEWHLLFNNYADVWGTQYFAEADVAEIPLAYAKAAEPTEKLTINVEESGEGGTLAIVWGEHQWTAAFTVAG